MYTKLQDPTEDRLDRLDRVVGHFLGFSQGIGHSQNYARALTA